jgi:hypothetical protein
MRQTLLELQMELMQVQREIQIVRRSGFNRLMAAAAASDILFRNTTAVGGGGFNALSKTGITTLTDAGAAGLSTVYNPTGNSYYIWNGVTPAFYVDSTSARIASLSSGSWIRVTTGMVDFSPDTGGTLTALLSTTGGWLLPKGVVVVDDDFTKQTWKTVTNTMGDWLASISAGGSIANAAGRGGLINIQSIITTPSFINLDGWLPVQTQDAPRIYARLMVTEVANTYKAWGLADATPAPGAGTLPYTNNAILACIDTAVGATVLLREVRAGAVTDTDTTIAIGAGTYREYDLIVSSAGVPTLYIGGTLRATGAAAQSPVTTTALQVIVYTNNLGAAVNSNLTIDAIKCVESRNTGAAA